METTPLSDGPPGYPGGAAAWRQHIAELNRRNAERADRLMREYQAARLAREVLGAVAVPPHDLETT